MTVRYPIVGDLPSRSIKVNPAPATLEYLGITPTGDIVYTGDSPEDAVDALQRARPGAPIEVEVIEPNDVLVYNPPADLSMMPRKAFQASGLPALAVDEVMALSVEDAFDAVQPLYKHLKKGGIGVGASRDRLKLVDSVLRQNYKTAKDHPEQPSEVQGLSFLPADKLKTYTQLDTTAFGRWVAGELGEPSVQRMETLCKGSNAMCRDSCLVFTGRNVADLYNHQRKATDSLALLQEPVAFARLLVEAIRRSRDRVHNRGLGEQFYVRLNVLSDIPWELVFPGLFTEVFPDVRFYDYTKVAGRVTPANYDLTFSYSGTNERLAREEIIHRNRRVAVVFLAHKQKGGRWQTYKRGAGLPQEFWGLPVVDGDVSDVRPLDPPSRYTGTQHEAPVIVGLLWKTPANVRIDPANFSFAVPAYRVEDEYGNAYHLAAVAPRHQPITES